MSNCAQAADTDYARIGWWQIVYRETGTLTGCQAEARFTDQTTIAMALIQDGSKSWFVFISNPRWNSWISRKRQHTLVVAAINPNRIWRGPWSVTDGSELVLNASVDFVNSIADAKQLAIFDENRRLLTPPLSMKDSEDAIKAVVNCVRYPPTNQPAPEAQVPPQEPAAFSSGTAFFVAPNLLLTANHVARQ